MPQKILIVDDDVDFVNLLGRRLKACNYEVIAAHDGIRAIRQAREQKPDLIVLDIRLPGGDGFKVYRSIRKNLYTSLIPIIFVTGFAKEEIFEGESIQKAFEKIGTPFLIKPFTADQILKKIKGVLKNDAAELFSSTPSQRELEQEVVSRLEKGE